jgi:UDP-GlcNAc:undecaprenyl-phosphate GlcNAc-1-phosphate transferase
VIRALLAFLIALSVTPLITLGMRRLHVIDVPNARSSHRHPTPRGGGIGVALAVVVAVALAPDVDGTTRAGLIAAGVAFGVVGLLEDLIGISALRRLPLLFLAAAVALPWITRDIDGGIVWAVALAVAALVWLVAYVNAFNFMDGINGLAAGQALVAGGVWYLIGHARDIPWLGAVGLVVAAAALGFAPHNVPRARVFLGDVGSYFLGGVLACTAVAALRTGLPPEAVLAPLALFAADTGVTLVRRVLRGDRWYEAHREHAYQRLTVLLGGSHLRTTVLVVAVMAACGALGAVSLDGRLGARLAADAAIITLLGAYLASPSLVAAARRSTPALA